MKKGKEQKNMESKDTCSKPIIYHLSQSVFYADYREESGSYHTFNILYTMNLNKALVTAKKILQSMPSLTLMRDEKVFPNGAVSYKGGTINYKKEQPEYKKALKLLLDELKYRGFCYPNDQGDILELKKAQIDKEYRNYYNKMW